nr:ribonuclease H-like domain-containing protein [Tanacetum cinerariifolium]
LTLRMHFLTVDLSGTVYMHQPPGFVDSRYPHHDSEVAYLLIYVDDIIRTASYTDLLQRIIASLHSEFDMTDLGALNYFLGISVVRHSTRLFLSQRKYALQLLDRAHEVNCNPSRTPVDTESKLGPEGVPIQNPTLYHSLAGGLQYLTFTRPDLSYAMQHICLYMHDPREPYFTALKRVLRYVQGTLDFSLHSYSSSTSSLVAYTDADWVGCPSTRHSTSRYCVFLGDSLLSWSSKRQHALSRFSVEAEYRRIDDSHVGEQEIPIPAPKKKMNRRRQLASAKKTNRNAEETLCVPWTTKEEVALCRSWVRISEDNVSEQEIQVERVEFVQHEGFMKGRFELNATVGDKEDEVQEVRPSRPMGTDQARGKGKGKGKGRRRRRRH